MHEKTRKIIDIFSRINMIPRCSKHEQAISRWLQDWAGEAGFASDSDPAGNLVIRVPATTGYEQAPVVVIQGHMDMVCEKTPESDHDFTKDPIRTMVAGDWVMADRTTLGADNGIALAIAMALAEDPTVAHPPLELLFTVDEETGLNGAKEIRPGFFEGKIFLNIDSETEGVFTVGCAGGRDIHIRLPFEPSPAPDGKPVKISVNGLCGGHSGIDIHKQRANANILLARTLAALSGQMAVRLAAISGGTVHNAIPRDAEAVIVCNEENVARVQEIVAAFEKTAQHEFARVEQGLRITATPFEADPPNLSALAVDQSLRIVRLLLALPHGVAGMSPDMAGLVETSNNLATVKVENDTVVILSSQRSAIGSRLDAISWKVQAVAALAGADAVIENEYPSWPPDMNSPLLGRCKDVYQDLFGKKPVVEVIHAGLECAIIGAQFKDMDMISYGPNMENPHSPDERLHIPSIEKIWDFTVSLLGSFKNG